MVIARYSVSLELRIAALYTPNQRILNVLAKKSYSLLCLTSQVKVPLVSSKALDFNKLQYTKVAVEVESAFNMVFRSFNSRRLSWILFYH